MANKQHNILFLLFLFTLSGCAASTLNSALDKGAKGLDANAIFTLVNDNTLRLVSSDFDAYTYCSPDGAIAAKSIVDTLDSGHWDIRDDATLCLKFKTWYYGDVNCYGVYQDPESDNYLLFSSNGALAYTATVAPGNSHNLTVKSEKGAGKTFLRSSMEQNRDRTPSPRPRPEPQQTSTPEPAPQPLPATSGPGASRDEIRHTVKSMAKDCPGCKLVDADLRKADLVGANLKGANLRGADLSRANLRRANLEGADLTGATLLSSNLPGANLRDADLSGADLTGANLIQADLTGATVDRTIFDNTLREGVKGLKQ